MQLKLFRNDSQDDYLIYDIDNIKVAQAIIEEYERFEYLHSTPSNTDGEPYNDYSEYDYDYNDY